ncbi:MAG: YbbR-like domain-containing protein [Acidobacteriota bacterium]|nr:MAG: YbbR-like domain-containing protein [Acidobacteriota bacterium]
MSLLRRLLLENLTLKLTSTLLAFLLWMQIAGQQRVQRNVAATLEFVSMPSGLEITNDYPKTVNILISTPSTVQMDERQVAAVIDLSGVEAGTNVIPLTERNFRNVPSGVEIVGIEQRRIRLLLERTRRKIVRIQPEIVGKAAEGFEVREVRLSPSEVVISGPESRLEDISTAATESIDISGRVESFTRTVYLDLVDPRLRIENISSVDVLVFIEEERKSLEIRVPVRVASGEPQGKISRRTVRATVSVPISFTEELDSSEFYALITPPTGVLAGGSVELAPVLVIPDNYAELVRSESIEPAEIQVTF